MKQLARQDILQALAVLGVRLSGIVDQDRFDEARELALANYRPLMLDNHPDRHASSGCSAAATARTQEISAADHLLKSIYWFQVAGLFGAGQVSRASSERHWRGGWSPTTSDRPGVRFYKRCPMCATLVQEGERHACKLNVDHFKTKARPFSYERPTAPPPRAECRNESPLGAFCTEPPGHDGEHRGYSAKGRHSWHDVTGSSFERVDTSAVGE